MKLVLTADLHGALPEIEPCDLLVIAGDVCPVEDHDPGFQLRWLEGEFSDWLRAVPATAVAWIAGNHDFTLERAARGEGPSPAPVADHVHYLCDSGAEIGGLRVWGVPWSLFPIEGWAFTEKQDDALRPRHEAIPDGTDVVIAHGPPFGHGDSTVHGIQAGSESLLERLGQVKPQLAVCGHIHEGYGSYEHEGIPLVNASHMTVTYEPLNPPLVVEF